MQQDVTCSECLEVAANAVTDRGGLWLCADCADKYYVACARCVGLIPGDVALTRDGAVYCEQCFAEGQVVEDADLPGDEEVRALVDEYIKLHSEEKRINERLEKIKERLKTAASVRQRVAGAVIFQSDEGMVRCRYTVKLRCDNDKVAALEQALGPDRFGLLFERKVSFSPLKENLQDFLSDQDSAADGLREAVRAAIEEVEVPALIVPPSRKPPQY